MRNIDQRGMWRHYADPPADAEGPRCWLPDEPEDGAAQTFAAVIIPTLF